MIHTYYANCSGVRLASVGHTGSEKINAMLKSTSWRRSFRQEDPVNISTVTSPGTCPGAPVQTAAVKY